MMRAKVVIGANWGDEGKGKLVDYLASRSQDPTLVVRFSGGANAGHTVWVDEGQSHVFGHVGSGTYLGCPTYLTEDFIVNPFLFRREYEELLSKGVQMPRIFINPNCKITTCFEMDLNRNLERLRGDARHGSVGVGIFETIKRHEKEPFQYGDFWASAFDWWDTFQRIGIIEYTNRAQELGVSSLLDVDLMFMKFKDEIAFLKEHTEPAALENLVDIYPEVIFEGSQGLALDQSRVWDMPHLTPANTGLKNVVKELVRISKEASRIDVHYVSRTYMTRHGAGPLPGETEIPFVSGDYETNVPNAYQGTFRYAPLNSRLLQEHIGHDYKYFSWLTGSSRKISMNYTYTCHDQVPLMGDRSDEPIRYVGVGRQRSAIIGDDL